MQFQKTSRSAIMAVSIALFGITPLCYAETANDTASTKEIKQETQELIQSLKTYTADQRDEAIQKTKVALNNLDQRIDALEMHINNNWDKMDKVTREKASESLQTLRKQRIQVAEWYGSLKNSSVGAWAHMKEGFSNAYKALHDAWEKSEKEFGSKK